MFDFDEAMDDYECPNCGGNGWQCRCTPQELEELEKSYRKKERNAEHA